MSTLKANTEKADAGQNSAKISPYTGKLDWHLNREPRDSHSVNDGVVIYFACSPGASLNEVADKFLDGYDAGGSDGEFSFYVSEIDKEGEELCGGTFRGAPNGEAYPD